MGVKGQGGYLKENAGVQGQTARQKEKREDKDMTESGMLRTALFGGFNKNDVRERIGTLEHELESARDAYQKEKAVLQEENTALKARAAQIEEELEKLKEERDGDFFDYETVNRIMEEARRSAAAIEEKSRIRAEQMIEEAKAETERQKEIIVKKINGQLEEKGIQLLAAKYKIEQYAKELDDAQQDLYNLNIRVKSLTDDMPVCLDDYWDGEYYRNLESRRQRQEEGKQDATNPGCGQEGQVRQ